MSPSYLLFVFFALFVLSAVADVYMQYPPGSNDRLDETSADRNNANRLFNSQNNARGGYCWGPELTYYEGSIMSVQWTNQHACGNSNTHCNLVLQYMCSTDHEGADETLIIRDGQTTKRIGASDDPTKVTGTDPEYYNVKMYQTDNGVAGDNRFFYGMHEPRSNWVSCKARLRNKGLWIADLGRNPQGSAMVTRQDGDENDRYGFECTEERDYYPYWHPSPWRDIVVFANKKSECDWYRSESQNVKAKNYCTGNSTAALAANNENDCMRADGKWESVKPWGIGKPECKEAPWNRDNHLGNGVDGHTNMYNWTLPRSGEEECIKKGNCTCVLRLRYNITVGELDGTEDWRLNGKAKSPIKGANGIEYKEHSGENFTININSDQTGRVFQDRSHMFRIAPRKNVPSDATIYNLNVRGKRGNIVQTFPATEYDFVPTFLEVNQGDYIHFQWTGCDTNPGGNQGNGKTGTDRSNIVQIADLSKNYPLNDTEIKNHKPLFKDPELRRRMAMIDQEDCLSLEDLRQKGGQIDQDAQNCMILNAAPTGRFIGAVVQMNDIGTYAYMSTRNNDFSNRGQKGQITVKDGWAAWKTAVIVIGGVAAIGIGAAVGTLFYVHKHPLSRAAEVVHKIPGLSKV